MAIASSALSLRNQAIWDDRELLAKLLPVASWGDVWASPLTPATYRPLGATWLYAEFLLFGANSWPYHFVCLVLCALAAVAFWLLARRLAGDTAGLLAGLFFAVHPIHAESGAMIYGQLELLAGLLVAAALLLWLQKRTGVALVLASCAYLVKESSLVLPLLALATGCLLHNRKHDFRRDLILAIPAAAYFGIRYLVLGTIFATASESVLEGYPVTMRIKAVVVALGEYLRLCLFPTGQTLYYGHLRFALLGRPWEQAGWIFAGAAVLWLCARELSPRQSRMAWFCGAWFVLALLPVLQIVPTGVLVSERGALLASFGVCLLLGVSLAPVPLRARFAVATALVVTGILVSTIVTTRWRNQEQFLKTTIASHPNSPMAHKWLGDWLLDPQESGIGKPEGAAAAILAFERALALNPDLSEAWQGIAAAEALRGNCTASQAAREKAGALRDALPACRQ